RLLGCVAGKRVRVFNHRGRAGTVAQAEIADALAENGADFTRLVSVARGDEQCRHGMAMLAKVGRLASRNTLAILAKSRTPDNSFKIAFGKPRALLPGRLTPNAGRRL